MHIASWKKNKKVSLLSTAIYEIEKSQPFKDLEKRRTEIHAHCQVSPMVYAHPIPQLLDREKEGNQKRTKYLQSCGSMPLADKLC